MRCLLYPQKRTWFGTMVMSALCQKQTCGSAKTDDEKPPAWRRKESLTGERPLPAAGADDEKPPAWRRKESLTGERPLPAAGGETFFARGIMRCK